MWMLRNHKEPHLPDQKGEPRNESQPTRKNNSVAVRWACLNTLSALSGLLVPLNEIWKEVA